MQRIVHKLSGSTLVETLVMMLVAGIVLLAVMDGMTLFSRLVARHTQSLRDTGRQSEGYYRTATLIARTDSIIRPASGGLELFQAGRRSQLALTDSAIIYRTDLFCDTLLTGIISMGLITVPGGTDTVEIGFKTGFKARFAMIIPARRYRTALKEIEKGYDYEE